MTNRRLAGLVVAYLLSVASSFGANHAPESIDPIRIGMIGLDTSHVPAFAAILNDPNATGDIAMVEVVAGYPGGTDLPASKDRVRGFTEQLRGMGVAIVDTLPELLTKVDAVMLESVDGRVHWDEARQVIRSGKPLFIDKPVAGSLADAIAIFELARKYNVPCFSSSAARFSEAMPKVREQAGEVIGCATWGPLEIQPGMPDLFFYGVHGVEALFTLMGSGCSTVARTSTESAECVTGVWKDGRIGTYRGIKRGRAEPGGLVFGDQGIVPVRIQPGRVELMKEVARFFKTGRPPVDAEQTIEIFAFMEAADESKRRGGSAVSLESVLAQARQEAHAKLAEFDEVTRVPPTEPAQALATFKIQPGFRLELVAAEPLVADPVALAFDENGRLFVAEMAGYPTDGDKKLGVVRLLEDRDGDGRFDQSTIFLDGVALPTAVQCYQGGVFVGAPPELLYCKDSDGDGRADVRVRVFTGFGTEPASQLLNSFRWGFDNRIHAATSRSGAEVRPADDPHAEAISLRGRDFCFDPRSRRLEPESGGAQHGLTYDAWGRKLVCHNSHHIQLVMYEDRYMPRNPFLAAPAPLLDIAQDGPAAEVYRISPVEAWRIIRTRMRVQGMVQGLIEGGGRPAGYFTSATGITVYTGDAWPKPFHGNAFIGEVAGNLVHRKRLESDGVGLIAQRIEQGEEFLASTDNWFRPVQFANAPDGTLYIADMYREFIEMPTAVPSVITQQVDWTSGRARGRIYRVVPDGFQQPPRPRLGEAATAELVATLQHPNGWHRETASRLLYERQDKAAVDPLATLARASSMPYARMHALYALDGLAALSDAVLLHALDDPHPRVREHAVRLTERLCRNSPEIQAKLCAMTDDVEPRVRYQLAFTLGELIASGPDVARADTNPKSQHGSGQDSPPLRIALRGHGARVPEPHTIQSGCLDALARLAATDAGDPWVRLAVVSSANGRAIELFVMLGDNRPLRRTDGAVALLGSLAECIGARHRPDEMGVLMKWLEALPDDDNATGLAVLSGLEQGLFRSGNSLSQLGLASAQPRVARLVEGVLTVAYATATDQTQSLNDRLQAVHALRLGSFAEVCPTLGDLLDLRHPQEVQRAAVETLVRFDEPEVGCVVLSRLPQLSPGVRRHAVDRLFSRGDWLAELLEAIRKDKVLASDLNSGQVQLALSYQDPAVRQKAEAVLVGLQPGRRQEVVAAYHDALQLSRDAARGKVVFSRVCAACHRLDARGYEVGPDLATIKNRGAEAILLNVLDPNREVDPQYVNYAVATTDGRVLTGMIGAETATSITLRGADGASTTVLRSTIDAVKNYGMSFMPEGLERDLSKQDLADLIEYLAQER